MWTLLVIIVFILITILVGIGWWVAFGSAPLMFLMILVTGGYLLLFDKVYNFLKKEYYEI